MTCLTILQFTLIVVTAMGALLILSLITRALVWIADVFLDWLLMRE